MARTAGSDGEKTAAAIREASLTLIARHGYDAVSMRQLGHEVGVQAAALYRYFPTKEDLLFTLLREHMEGLIASWAAARPVIADPAMLKGRRYGNIVIAGSDVPIGDSPALTRTLLGGVPAQIWLDPKVRGFAAAGKVLRDIAPPSSPSGVSEGDLPSAGP